MTVSASVGPLAGWFFLDSTKGSLPVATAASQLFEWYASSPRVTPLPFSILAEFCRVGGVPVGHYGRQHHAAIWFGPAWIKSDADTVLDPASLAHGAGQVGCRRVLHSITDCNRIQENCYAVRGSVTNCVGTRSIIALQPPTPASRQF